MKTLKIATRDLQTLIDREPSEFPKYVTQILNLANQNAGGTRPRVVGQLSDLIQNFDGSTIDEWEGYYKDLYPNAVTDATKRVSAMVENLKIAIEKIDDVMIEEWVKDLIFVKTFLGLRFQSAILRRVAQERGEPFSLSNASQEAANIDGFIGARPISIKPDSYRAMMALPEYIGISLIFYKKTKDGISIEYDFD